MGRRRLRNGDKLSAAAQGVTAYYSCHPGDSDFGARHDPLRARWTGSSLCTPPWDMAILSKAVAWAIRSADAADLDASAGADAPAVLTILVAPDMGSGPAFQAHLEAHPQQCRLLARVGRQHTRLARPGPGRAWKFEPVRPQFGMRIYAIGNREGLNQMKDRVFQTASTRREAGRLLTAAVRDTLPLAGEQRLPVITLAWPSAGVSSQATLTHAMPGGRVTKLLPDTHVRAVARRPAKAGRRRRRGV